MAAQRTNPMAEGALDGRLIRIYLRDHLAAAVGGAELARRTLGNNRGASFEPTLEQLAMEIEEDRQTLVRIMGSVGVTPDVMKQGAVWAFEKIARLKLNGRVLQYSPLSRLVEFEALESGIEAKRAMWAALRHVADADPRLDAAEFQNLEKRAVDQRNRIEAIRLQAARLALVTA
jgi:hypothetical protein